MRPFKLHLKTTLLVSVITLAVMIVLLLVISARLVDLMRNDEKTLTEIGAASLAEHLGQLQSIPDANELERATALVRAARSDAINVRVWEVAGNRFVVKWSTDGNATARGMSDDVAKMLRGKRMARIESLSAIASNENPYRVFVPIVRQKQLVGAVEISDRIDNLPSLLQRSAATVMWLALIAVGLIGVATYVLFRDLIYQPIEQLLKVIAQAKSGNLDVKAPDRGPDELGRLSQEFNGMMGQIHEMTMEREHQQEVLHERIHEATAQLEQRNEQLASANQELWRTTRRMTQLERLAAAEQTAAQFAHEVGTPLNLIGCHTQLLQTEVDTNPASVKERVEIVIEQIERIERIVRRMLDRTRSDHAQLSPLDLNDLIRRIVDATAPTMDERRVEHLLDLDPYLPQIAGDADKLQQVFLNLINNALDAMPDGGVLTITSTISSTSKDDAPRLTVAVSDTGCGMTSEVQRHIFDPLYTTKKRGKGTGIGLVVVNQVMHEHGGTVTVDSTTNGGSRFVLSFPVLTMSQTAIAGSEFVGSLEMERENAKHAK